MQNLIKYVDLAKGTTDAFIQKDFLKSSEMLIRKALASNPFISRDIANQLAFDKTVNVAYVAMQNKNCTVKRVFREVDMKNRCVLCYDVLNDVSKCQRC